jgi:hypothetical protein
MGNKGSGSRSMTGATVGTGLSAQSVIRIAPLPQLPYAVSLLIISYNYIRFLFFIYLGDAIAIC